MCVSHNLYIIYATQPPKTMQESNKPYIYITMVPFPYLYLCIRVKPNIGQLLFP